MDKGSIEVLKENLYAVNSSMKRLMYSFDICSKTGLKDNYSDEEFVEFDAMTARYARTTDMLINKVLRSLDAVEYNEEENRIVVQFLYSNDKDNL
jgi:hypothetical protein